MDTIEDHLGVKNDASFLLYMLKDPLSREECFLSFLISGKKERYIYDKNWSLF